MGRIKTKLIEAQTSPLEINLLAQIDLVLVFTPQLDQHKFIGNYRAGHTQDHAPGQVEELHAGKGDRVGGHLLVEATQLQAPRLSGHHANKLHGPPRLVVDLRGEHNHGQGASYQQDQREPKVKSVEKRGTGSGRKKGRRVKALPITINPTHCMLFNS